MNYIVCQADIKRDREEIVQFWNKNHDRPLNVKYDWIYEGNPQGPARVWLLRTRKRSEIVGMTALFPRTFKMGDRILNAGVTGDLYVDKRHRTFGPAVMLLRALVSSLKKGNFDFFYGFPNKDAEPVLARAGFRILGPWMRLSKVMKIKPYLRQRGLGEAASKAISPFLDCVLRWVSRETWARKKGYLVCQEVPGFDNRFDKLCNQIMNSYSLVGDRNQNFLRWKFLGDPDDVNKIFTISDTSSKGWEKGAIIYRWEGGGIDIRDIICNPDDTQTANFLLTSFLSHARKKGAQAVVIHMMKNTQIRNIFKHFGFRERPTRKKTYVYCSDRLKEHLNLIGDRLFFTQADEDT